MQPTEFHILDDFAVQAACRFVDFCKSTIGRQGRIHVGLAGGNTPRDMYRCLARPEILAGLDVRAIEFYQGDERPVPLSDPDSNWGMATAELLDPAGVPDENRHRMLAEAADLDGAASDYERLLRNRLPLVGGMPSFDLLLLGMGVDGHTASLFPGTAALGESERLVVANHVPEVKTVRLTATYLLINAARAVWIVVNGDKKAQVIRQALELRDPSLPVTQVAPRKGRLAWLLDRPAASLLSPNLVSALGSRQL